MANRTSLASAIRTAATQVSGASSTSTTVNRNYASSRIGLGLGPGVTRTASMNTVTTSPNFYSPFLTPSSFQIPNARREVYLWANWWRNNEPKIAAAVNFYTNYPFSGWKLECSSSYVKDYFEKLVESLNFQNGFLKFPKHITCSVIHLFCFLLIVHIVKDQTGTMIKIKSANTMELLGNQFQF